MIYETFDCYQTCPSVEVNEAKPSIERIAVNEGTLRLPLVRQSNLSSGDCCLLATDTGSTGCVRYSSAAAGFNVDPINVDGTIQWIKVDVSIV